MCCSPCGCKESDATEQLKTNKMLSVQNNDDTGLAHIGTSNHLRFGNTHGGQGVRKEQLKCLKNSRLPLVRDNKGYKICITCQRDKEKNIATYSFLKDSSSKENYLT